GDADYVLVVEEDSMLVATLLSIIKAQGYPVASCPGPEEALEYCQVHPRARVVLSNVVFPGSDLTGIEAAQRMSRISAARTVLMSHYERRLIAHIAGFDRYPFLSHPLSANQVLTAVASAWSHRVAPTRRSQNPPEAQKGKQRRLMGD